MNASQPPAKITRPVSSGVSRRYRLFRLLDHGGSPIFWITGPPGAGKTTLVASWLEDRGVPCLWYHVDERDSDPASLFYFLGLAAKKATPRKKNSLPLLTPEYLLGIPAFSRRFFENLYARFGNRPSRRAELTGGRPAVMVFDNCQEVAESSRFHDILYEGLSLVPHGIRVILISRKDPPVAFVRLRANSLMKIIGWEDLKFTLDESVRMARLRGQNRAGPDVLRRLHEKTEGWAAGMVLLLEGAKNGGIESVLSKAGVPRQIFQYFVREIFERSEPATRNFLLKTSLLPRTSVKMAEALTGNDHADRILQEMHGRNYFTQRLESNTALYEYHPLFREFLQLLAVETLDSEEFRGIEIQAAVILEENGYTEDALELLRKAGDWQSSTELILRHAGSLTVQGRGRTLEGWIAGLPETVVKSAPWLIYWTGVCRLSHSPRESHLLFREAFNLFRAEGRDVAGIFFSLAGIFDSIFYSLGSFEPFDTAISLLKEVIDGSPGFPSFEIEARLTTAKLYALFLRQPWHPKTDETAEQLLSILPMITDLNMKTQALHCLLGHRLFFGDVQTAGPLVDLFRGLPQAPDAHPLSKTVLDVAVALYYLLVAEFRESGRAVEEGLEIASKTGVHVVDTYLLGYGTATALSTGDMQAADEFLRRMAASVDREHYWGRQFHQLMCAWKLLLEGNPSESLRYAEASLMLGIEAGSPITLAYSYFFCAVVLHELERDDEAEQYLAEGHAIARSAGAVMVEFACMLAEAWFAYHKGDEASGAVALRKALSLGHTRGYVNTFFTWIPHMMAELCLKALEEGIEPEYARHIIRKRDLMPAPVPVDCEKWPWAIRIFTLGRFEIVKDGDPGENVQLTGKVQKKPLEMLKALAANGGREASEEQISDRLWPDANGDAAHSAFSTTLSRLRKILGIEGAIRLQDGKVSINPRYCWVDALAFERVLARLEKLDDTAPAPGEKSVIDLVEKTVALYKGHFLPGDEGQFWTISYRERLRSAFSRLINRAGDRLEKAGLWEKAMDYYQKGLDIDELSEEFYQRLMVCNQELGRHSNAIEVYNRCRKLFLSKMGVEPSAKTRAILGTFTTLPRDGTPVPAPGTKRPRGTDR